MLMDDSQLEALRQEFKQMPCPHICGKVAGNTSLTQWLKDGRPFVWVLKETTLEKGHEKRPLVWFEVYRDEGHGRIAVFRDKELLKTGCNGLIFQGDDFLFIDAPYYGIEKFIWS
jgi:hypothetical protein